MKQSSIYLILLSRSVGYDQLTYRATKKEAVRFARDSGYKFKKEFGYFEHPDLLWSIRIKKIDNIPVLESGKYLRQYPCFGIW